MARNVLAAVEMATARFHTGGYTPYEGQLQHPANLQKLAERFHLRRQFSATEFESYAQCPFRYWLEYVLGLAPLPEVDDGTDHLRRGVVVHHVLAELMPEDLQDPATLTVRFQELVEHRLGRQLGETEFRRRSPAWSKPCSTAGVRNMRNSGTVCVTSVASSLRQTGKS